MVFYNSNKTAYYRTHDGDWYIVPAGKVKAPRSIRKDTVRLRDTVYLGLDQMNHFDQADREVLLEAHRLGVLNETWKKFRGELKKREDQAAIYREELATKLVTRATVDRRVF